MKPFVSSFAIAVAGSVLANILILAALGPLVINPEMPLRALSMGPVTTFSIAGALGATMVYAAMRRVLADPDRPFLWLSAIILIASFIPDFMIVGQTTGAFAGGSWASALVLMLMHTAEAAIVVWALVKLWGPRTITDAALNPAVQTD